MTERINDKRVRREKFVQGALRVAKRDGFDAINKESVAKECGVSESLIYKHFKSMSDVRKVVMVRAVSSKNIPIIAKGISYSYRECFNLDERVKSQAVEHMLKGCEE